MARQRQANNRYGIRLPLLSESRRFEAVYQDNAAKATMRATADLNGARLTVETRNLEHFNRTLDHWRKLGATNIRNIREG